MYTSDAAEKKTLHFSKIAVIVITNRAINFLLCNTKDRRSKRYVKDVLVAIFYVLQTIYNACDLFKLLYYRQNMIFLCLLLYLLNTAIFKNQAGGDS